jgi:hypothetical protein
MRHALILRDHFQVPQRRIERRVQRVPARLFHQPFHSLAVILLAAMLLHHRADRCGMLRDSIHRFLEKLFHRRVRGFLRHHFHDALHLVIG